MAYWSTSSILHLPYSASCPLLHVSKSFPQSGSVTHWHWDLLTIPCVLLSPLAILEARPALALWPAAAPCCVSWEGKLVQGTLDANVAVGVMLPMPTPGGAFLTLCPARETHTGNKYLQHFTATKSSILVFELGRQFLCRLFSLILQQVYLLVIIVF